MSSDLCEPLGEDPPSTRDALSHPTDVDLLPSLLALQPLGPAWRSPDGAAPDTDSRMARFWQAVAAPLVDLYNAAWRITQESTACTLDESLADWEAEYGLPDPCLGAAPTYAARLFNLRLRVAAHAVNRPVDFICLAALVGYTVTIEEPQPFEFGRSQFGGTDQISGEVLLPFYWIVHVEGYGLEWFEFGRSIFGRDPLGQGTRAEDLECLFLRIAPATSLPLFD